MCFCTRRTYLLGILILCASGYSLKEALFEFASAVSNSGLSVGVISTDMTDARPVGINLSHVPRAAGVSCRVHQRDQIDWRRRSVDGGNNETERRVIQTKADSRKRETGKNLRCLLCDVSGRYEPKSVGEEWVRTPTQCLHKAVEGNPGIIVICFGPASTSGTRDPNC